MRINQKSGYSAALFIVLFVSALGCLEPFNPPVLDTDNNFLVVDAFLDAGGTAAVQLSRTSPLYSNGPARAETGAVVSIEDEFGTTTWLSETAPGQYGGTVAVDPLRTYRVHLRTADSHDYFSAFVAVKLAPPIDTLYWEAEDNGIRVFVETHDPSGSSRYYKWDFVETFQYTSAFYSAYKIVDGVVVERPQAESIYTCWTSDSSRNIAVGSSAKLVDDVIRRFPVTFIPRASRKISTHYSVNVRQRVLTEDGYDYWRQLEQTTENLGGLFDPMPVKVTGNLYCATRPSEAVLGFFSAGTEEEKRVFIRFLDLPDHLRKIVPNNCEVDTILVQDIAQHNEFTLITYPFGAPFTEGYLTSSPSCIDCRLQGGTTTKPPFWE